MDNKLDINVTEKKVSDENLLKTIIISAIA